MTEWKRVLPARLPLPRRRRVWTRKDSRRSKRQWKLGSNTKVSNRPKEAETNEPSCPVFVTRCAGRIGSMSAFPGSPRVLKGGLVLLDPDTFTVLPNGIIVLQYNPDTLSRTLKIQGAEEGGDRSEALRLKGPPVETFKLDAEIDATDQLENPDQNPKTVQNGIFPQLAALETIVYPSSTTLQNNFNLSQSGILEIMPIMAPLPLFVWSANRIVPVRITDLSITEEAFDGARNRMRATVGPAARVRSTDAVN